MKTKTEIEALLNANTKELERELDTQIRNGQHTRGVKEALRWVLK